MKQGLILHHIATGIIQEVPLNGKEMQLAMDNGPTVNDSWDLMVASVPLGQTLQSTTATGI